jgi:hypothetical protein
MVDEAVEKKPLKPRTVEVELYPVFEVNGKVPEVRQLPAIEKHPVVILNPTFEVEVAEPFTVRPVSVVVPKPMVATVNLPLTSKRPAGLAVPTPTLPDDWIAKSVEVAVPAVDEPTAKTVPAARAV